jgi:hypothetical protein
MMAQQQTIFEKAVEADALNHRRFLIIRAQAEHRGSVREDEFSIEAPWCREQVLLKELENARIEAAVLEARMIMAHRQAQTLQEMLTTSRTK